MKVALVAPGHPFKMALDIGSKRKLATLVSFDDGERRFGNGAKSLLTKRPGSSFNNMGTLLGKKMNTPLLEEFTAQYYPYKFVEDEERGTIKVVLPSDGDEETSFSMEEVVAMYLKHAQDTAVEFLQSETAIRDCVITAPDFFSTKERNALADAAALAGLNVLDIINENSAAALYYGIERHYDVNKTETFILYNMGGVSTKVAVVEYAAYTKNITKRKQKTFGQVNVLSHAWDETLGGNAFDSVLVEMTKKTAEEQLGTELATKERAMARLRVAAEKGKRVLSANKDASIRITSLWDDQDFKQRITRDEFIGNCQSLLDRVLPPIDVALERSGKTKDDISGIILMGGGSRVPKIQELLHDYLDKELKKDLNTDEAAALGAAFRAANESTQFQVRKIGFTDTSPFTVHATHINNFDDYEASLEDESIDLTELFHKSAEIFESGHVLKKRKSVSFKHDKDLYVSIAHDEKDPLPAGTHPHIDHYNVSGIERAVKDYAERNVTDKRPNIRLSFLADGSGVVKLAKAIATFQENVEVAVPRTPPKSETDDKKKKKKKGKKGKADKENKGEDEEKSEGEKEGEEETEGESETEETEDETETETNEETEGEEKAEEKKETEEEEEELDEETNTEEETEEKETPEEGAGAEDSVEDSSEESAPETEDKKDEEKTEEGEKDASAEAPKEGEAEKVEETDAEAKKMQQNQNLQKLYTIMNGKLKNVKLL